MRDFRDLSVWQKSHALAIMVYKATTGFPKDEHFGLTSQMRRASVSVAANIAEGCGRGSEAELARFLQIAMGSSSELEYHVVLANDLCFLDSADYAGLVKNVQEVKKMLASFILKLKADR